MKDDLEIEKQYYSIGEVAEMLDVNPSLIRFWESEFDSLSPKKNRKGNRMYTKKDIALLKQIYFLVKVRKFTLEGAQEMLVKNPKNVDHNQKTRETLINLKEFLVDLKNAL